MKNNYRDINEEQRKKALAVLKILETKCNVWDLTIHDVPIWWFVRTRVYKKLLQYVNDDLSSGFASRNILEVANRLKHILNELVQMLVLLLRAFRGMIEMGRQKRRGTRCKVMCLSVSDVFRGMAGKAQSDVYFEFLLRHLGRECVIVERPMLEKWDQRSLFLRRDVIFFDWALLQGAAILLPRLLKVPRIVNWESFECRCKSECFEGLTSDLVLSIVEESVNEVWRKVLIQVKASEILLRKLQPQIVTLITSYDSAPRAMCLVAGRQKIPVIELQHGLISRSHIGYTYYLPGDYQGELPLPRKILVYGEAFGKAIVDTGNAFTADTISVTGFPRMARFMKRVEYEGRTTIREATRRWLGLGDNQFVISVTTQPTTSSCLSAFLGCVLKELNKMDVVLCIKPHPSELGTWQYSYLNLLNDSRVKVVLDKDVDLYELLIASDVHATVCSTVFLECLSLGVPNIIVGCPRHEIAFELVDRQTLLVAETPAMFAMLIRKLAESPEYRDEVIRGGKQVAGKFFSTNGDPESNIFSWVVRGMSL